MSVTVLFNGKRQCVKVPNANAFVSSVIEETLAIFKLPPCDATSYAIKHKGRTLDRGQPFRYCNIPNNAVLDLEFIANSKHGCSSTKETKIALTTETAGSLVATFDSSNSLQDVLDYFILKGDLDSGVLGRSPEIIYVRNSFSREDLLNKTLQSLGLEGQSVRFQLRLGAAAASLAATASSSNRSSLSPNSIIEDKLAYAKAAENDSDYDSTFYSKSSDSGAYLRSLREDRPVGKELHIAEEKVSGRSPPTVPMTVDSDAVSSDDHHERESRKRSTKAIMADILAANFDAVSVPAVVTMAKYVYNILSDPTDERFRSINTSNKSFKEKVWVAEGASSFLEAIGFVPMNTPQGVFLQLESLGGSDSDTRQLELARDVLDSAMDTLKVRGKDRPVLLRPPAPSSSSGLQAFDPFKASLTRTAPQPRDSSSLTHRKLELLMGKRREAEGRPEDVERQTQLLMPSADGSVPGIEDFAIDAGVTIADGAADDGSMAGDSRLLAATVKSLLQQASTDAPLKTKAMRDLERMQSSRVYTRAMVRVRFPDRACVQGYLHPRNVVADLYSWVQECLGVADRPFELYTSPPRQVLPRDKSLAELQLVPAALIHLSWLGASAAASTADAPIGHYLCNRLLLQSSDKGSAVAGTSSSFPVGELLQREGKVAAPNAATRQYAEAGDDTDGGSKAADSKSGAKPKWLKLGHK